MNRIVDTQLVSINTIWRQSLYNAEDDVHREP